MIVLAVIAYAVYNRSSVMIQLHQLFQHSNSTCSMADANNNGCISKAELKKLTKVQLVEFADKKGLKIKRSGLLKHQLSTIYTHNCKI